MTDNNNRRKKRNNQYRQLPFLMEGINFNKTKTGSTTIQGKIGIANNNNLHEYYRLIKEADRWGGMGQTRLEREANRRANCLLVGNIPEYKKSVNSEILFMKTNKFTPLNI